MKKSFDDICKEFLGEVSQVSTNPTTAAGGGALTSAQRTVTGNTETPAEQQKTNQPQQQNNTDTSKEQTTDSLKPEDVLKAFTQIDPNHPELHSFMDKLTKAIADKQKQTEYNKQTQANASQTQPTA